MSRDSALRHRAHRHGSLRARSFRLQLVQDGQARSTMSAMEGILSHTETLDQLLTARERQQVVEHDRPCHEQAKT